MTTPFGPTVLVHHNSSKWGHARLAHSVILQAGLCTRRRRRAPRVGGVIPSDLIHVLRGSWLRDDRAATTAGGVERDVDKVVEEYRWLDMTMGWYGRNPGVRRNRRSPLVHSDSLGMPGIHCG